jgi:preprotein translocase subunit SecA
LAALHLYQRDRHYIVRKGKVCIVDQTTGRLAHGRVWARSLHQLMEIKESCEITGAQDTLAQITFQRFFPRYWCFAGTSGTLREARAELMTSYGLGVQRVPLRRPSQRRALGIGMYATWGEKWRQAIREVKRVHGIGRPILIGTDSVAQAEHLSKMLAQAGLDHQTLNALQDDAEAQIIARAGAPRTITVATNMAGRGTDIALGEGVAAMGGLHVISCQLNPEARIDRQLHGRAGRQGDPGTVRTILCLEEPLIERWIHPGAIRCVASLAGRDGEIPGWITISITGIAQWFEEVSRGAQRRNLMRREVFNERRLSISGSKD